ncbi:MAG: metallophosphoesterase [Ignavibacteria bacterium]|nr:metallophosphoesterase [Ignavibacteria bacterium]
MKKSFLLFAFILQIGFLFGQKDFSFVFLPDTHLQPDSSVEAKFDKVAKQINELNPDFVISGGDMIYTAKNVNEKKAKILFDFMDSKFRQLKMPVHYTLGNHECVGILAESGMGISHSLYGKGMYEQRYGKRYQSLTNSGWNFFLLDGIKILDKERNYTAGVDSVQIDWIRKELQLMDKTTPIVIVIHTPLLNPHAIKNSRNQLLSQNSADVLNLFRDHNLKIILQGHTHLYMNLFFDGVHYISGGSTSQATHLNKYSDGFIFVKISNNTEEIKFIPTAINTQ